MDAVGSRPDIAFEGDGSALRNFLNGLPDGTFYTYVLLKPSRQPFYVGKGTGQRVLHHRLEAMRLGLSPKSNPFKCNTIRRIIESGADLLYRIDHIFANDQQLACLTREETLIGLYKRRCDGGILTNLAAGLGSLSVRDTFSTERHAATLSGVSAERPERTALNLFLRALGGVDSLPIKPLSEYRTRLVAGYPSPKNLKTLSRRNGLTLAASAIATGLVLLPGIEIPRAFDYVPDTDDWPLVEPPPPVVPAVNENGALSDILKLGLADLVSAPHPEQERLRLSAGQIARLCQIVGTEQTKALGLQPV